jgi:hypothetical protein
MLFAEAKHEIANIGVMVLRQKTLWNEHSQ